MTFEDGDNFKGHFDIIPGMAFSIYNAEGRRFTYDYCSNDLADEIVGMWVCTDGPANKENDMLIQTFNEDGSSVMTGDADELLVNDKETVSCVTFRMNYSANVTALVSGNPYLPVLLQLAPQDR